MSGDRQFRAIAPPDAARLAGRAERLRRDPALSVNERARRSAAVTQVKEQFAQ